jgi:hypothetical protein
VGGSDPTDWIARAEEAGLELRRLTREAHEACRDAKEAKKDLIETYKGVKKGLSDRLQTIFDTEVKSIVATGMTKFLAEIDEAIDSASKSVDLRFEAVQNLLLGVEQADPRKPSIEETAFAYHLVEVILEDDALRDALEELWQKLEARRLLREEG